MWKITTSVETGNIIKDNPQVKTLIGNWVLIFQILLLKLPNRTANYQKNGSKLSFYYQTNFGMSADEFQQLNT